MSTTRTARAARAPQEPTSAATLAAWNDALDLLERDVASTTALLDAHPGDDVVADALERANAWRVPQGLGPLPPELAERARQVLADQKEAAARLARAMSASRRHTRALDAADQRPPAVPVYLDAEA